MTTFHPYRPLAHWRAAGCLLAVGVWVSACQSDDIGPGMGTGAAPPHDTYVTLSFTQPRRAALRATGVEWGDGPQEGLPAESRIESAVAFFYAIGSNGGADDLGINAHSATPIRAVAHFELPMSDMGGSSSETGGTNAEIEATYTTGPQLVNLPDGTYHVIVVANEGSDPWWDKPGLTLGDVRRQVDTTLWSKDAGGEPTAFMMASAADATISLQGQTRNDPARATVSVERLAARVDYQATGAYKCTDPAYKGATVSIEGATIVNDLTKGTFLIKRLADTDEGADPTVRYLAVETDTNYVITPWWPASGAEHPDYYRSGTYFGALSTDALWWGGHVQPGTPIEGETGWHIVGYTQENTTSRAHTDRRANTAVVFKAQFRPAKVTGEWAEGDTFFAIGSELYATMEDVMLHLHGTVFNDWRAPLGEDATWQQVKERIGKLSQASLDASGYLAYLQGRAEGKDEDAPLIPEERQELGWDAYMRSQCGYAPRSTGSEKVQLNLNGCTTSDILARHGVRTYANARCYYTWWLRHNDDDDPDAIGPMEYAVVRNNVYRLEVRSIYSLGGYVPTEESQPVIRVYVNDWQLLPEEEIEM